MRADPLKKCPRGCIFEATRKFCPWHGEPLGSLIGTRVADVYVIKRLLSAAGGFGVVYYAETELGFEAAVKVLRPPACYDERAVDDFVQEARKALQLEGCPNTVGVLVCGVQPFPFIVMTFVSGGPLSDRIRTIREEVQSANGNVLKERSKRISVEFSYRVLVDIASALKVAHEKGIVHRDLKPGNALIRRDPEGRETVLVSDWGIAIARREGRRGGMAAEDETLVPTRKISRADLPPQATLPPVTINRAPPEFFKSNIDDLYKPSADIYQFGIMAYEVLTGEFPFAWPDGSLPQDESWEYWRRQHCRIDGAGPVPLKQYRADLTRRWNPISTRKSRMAKVVARCLEERPTRRYPSGGKLLEALTEIPRGEKVARYAAAPVLLLIAFAVVWFFFVNPPTTLKDFFDTGLWAEQTAGVSADDQPDAIVSGKDRYAAWRIWARSFGDLKKRRGEEPLVYKTYSLGNQTLGALEGVALERWQTALPVEEALRRPAPFERTGTLEGYTTAEENSVSVHLGKLADYLEKESGGADRGVFTFAIGMDFEKQPNVKAFFQIVIDPRPPAFDLEKLMLVAPRNPFDGKSYRIEALKARGEPPPRLFAPELYEDLECVLALVEEDLDPSPVIMARIKDQGISLGQMAVKSRVPFRWFGGSARRPEALPGGTSLRIEVWAVDRAGRTRGEEEFSPETTKAWSFVLDSGPEVTVLEKKVIKEPGEAFLPVRVKATDPSSLRLYWGIEEGSLALAPLDPKDLQPDGGVRFRLPANAPAKLEKGGSIDLLCLEGDLIYPGLAGPPDDKGWLELVSNAARPAKFEVVAEEKIAAAAFRIRMEMKDAGVAEKTLRQFAEGDAFEWRTNARERFPTKLFLENSGRKDLDLAKTSWSQNDLVVSTGSDFTLAPPGEAATSIELMLDIRSNWGTEGRFPVRIEYQRDRKLFGDIQVEDEGPRRVAFGEDNVLHTRNPKRLTFFATPVASRLDVSKARLTGSARYSSAPELVFRLRQPVEDLYIFDLDNPAGDPIAEGIYELKFTCRDLFESSLEQTSYLYVHGAKPRILLAVPGTCDGERSVPLPSSQGECVVRIEVSDPSGIRELGMDLGEGLIDVVKGGILTEKAQLEMKGLGEQDFDVRQGTILSVAATASVAAGKKSAIQVNALDDPVGEPAGKVSCRTTITCGEEDLPDTVEWLGLDWVKIEGGSQDESFYITRYEVPVWFWKGPGESPRPPDEELARWAPQTGVAPEEIDRQLQTAPRLREVYLPTLDEWRRIARSGGKTDFIATGKVAAADRATPQYAILGKIVNCSLRTIEKSAPDLVEKRNLLNSELVPANYRPEGADAAGLFYGTLHFLGNAEEIVTLREGAYGAVGGTAGAALDRCIEVSGYAIREPSKGDNRRGFRLVVYPSGPAAKVGGPDRVASDEFGKQLRRRP